ncbi:MAG: DNA gyrase inhibitor YacG [Acidobacteria bacterium]|nr:DNA gyrase inhibitor YacG [Acidobacteriota bacterium]
MKCPICRQTASWEGNPNRPFCSERCRLIDLGNWAAGQYSLPAQETDREESAEEEQNAES